MGPVNEEKTTLGGEDLTRRRCPAVGNPLQWADRSHPPEAQITFRRSLGAIGNGGLRAGLQRRPHALEGDQSRCCRHSPTSHEPPRFNTESSKTQLLFRRG